MRHRCSIQWRFPIYSQKAVQRTIDDFARLNGWTPEPHSIEEVDGVIDHIDSLLETESTQTYTRYTIKRGLVLSKAEKNWIRRWIENEQFMSFASAEYFITRYGRIRTADERIVHFSPRDAQKLFLAILAEFDDLQIAIQVFCLKCRQLGVSTWVALCFLHRILFRPNTYAVMASVQAQQSEKLGKMIDVCHSRLPFWLPPPKTVTKGREPQWANNSVLSIQSGTQEVGIGQGTSPSCVHISEIGDYKTPKKTLEEGLFPACIPTSSLFLVLEGTGSMSSPWQQEKWDFYKANWGNGGRFRPIFIPPACARDLYPLPDWLRAHPILESWRPMDETMRMKRRAELFIRSTDYLARVMGGNWKMDREYMWFWETMWREAVASHTEKTMLSQYACTDNEAFQSPHDTVFNDETIELVTRTRERAYTPYAITGKTIIFGSDNQPYEPNPDDIAYDLERIQIHWEAPDGNRYDWELVPLKQFDDSDDVNCFNKLLIFHAPIEGADYSIGVDTAQGLGLPNEDRSVCSAWANQTGRGRDDQVASFTSNNVNSAQMARVAACVAALYGSDGNGNATTEDPLGCKFAIEQIRKTGDECQLQLKLMGFYNHHLFHFYDEKGNIDPTRGHKEGWRTTPWSRSLLLDRFVGAVNTGWVKCNCPILIRQLKTFVRIEKGGRSTMGHPPGGHDDNVFAAAMAYTTRHDLEDIAARHQQKYQSEESDNQAPDYRWASNQIQLS